ncbi:MAG: DUF4135 domain-containing protein [Verrucomicrobia bacterium]|nr:DUF4135 domain-containing protein [Verrucomicrobiota bacterium]
MSQPVKRDAATQGPEEFRLKRPTLKRAVKAEEILSSSPHPSPERENPLKRRLSSSPPSVDLDNVVQIENITTESKTASVAGHILSPPPAAAGVADLPLSAFSTPPSKHHRRVSFSSTPGSEKGSPRSKTTVSPFALGIANERIEQSKLERRKRLQAFTDNLPQRIEAFEKDLQPLGELAKEYWVLRKRENIINGKIIDLQGISPTESTEKRETETEIAKFESELELVEKEVKKKEEALNDLRAELLKKFPDLNFEKDDFSSYYRASNTSDEHLKLLQEMLCEQLANKCVNRRLFLVRVVKDIEKHKEDIVKGFYRKDVDVKTLEEISFNPVLSSAETHNRGEVATRIEFFQKNQLLFTVYYKPRDARIDAAVIDLFRAINRLPPDSKLLKVKLPEYQIVSFVNNDENFSIWEYIDGKSHEGRANAVINHLKADQKINSRQEKILLDKLRRLESVCQPIALSDLHTANVLFRNLSSEDPEIVPIDLESIQEDAGTGLYEGKAPEMHLSPQESELVKKFRNNIYSTPFRLVSLATGEFEGSLLEPTSYEKFAELFMQKLESQDYQFLSSKKEIFQLILDDYLNNDIPYLVSYQEGVFYGPLKHGKKIAIKKLEEEKK